MSVSGEFRRCRGACLDLLASVATAGAEECSSLLGESRQRGLEDLSAGARLVLDAAEAREPLRGVEFRTPLDRERFAERLQHLVSICRIILGR